MTETRPRVYIPTEPLYAPTGEVLSPGSEIDNALVAPPQEQGTLSRAANRLLGTQFGEERFQTWPEKMVRSAATLAGDVLSGEVPVLPPGSRREDVTDEPAPGVDANAPWWKPSRWIAPVAAQPNDKMMERAQDLAGVAMGGGIGGTGKAAAAGEAVLGSGPIMVVARKMPTGELKTGKPGQIHSDLLTDAELIAGVNTATGEMGFALPDGRYLTRNQALEHALKNEPERAYDANAKGRGLEAVKYNEEPVAAGGKTLRSGMGDEGAGPVPLNQKGPPWFSAVENALEQTSMGSAPGAQWLATLRNARGVKPEEMAWLGLDDMLAEAQLAGRKVTRAEIQDHIKSHQVELRDVTKGEEAQAKPWESLTRAEQDQVWTAYQHESGGGGTRPSDSVLRDFYNMDPEEFGVGGQTKYQDYQLPGGENYREHLITMPSGDINARVRAWAERKGIDDIGEAYRRYGEEVSPLRTNQDGSVGSGRGGDYKSSHWEEPNILAHVRTNDRVIDGKRSLHLEEVQSDWHQQGRDKGYQVKEVPTPERKYGWSDNYGGYVPVDDAGRPLSTRGFPTEAEARAHSALLDERFPRPQFTKEGVPDAPFKKSWHELALKRMLRRAAEEGYERLSWTPGDAQAARYSLSKQVDNIKVEGVEGEPGVHLVDIRLNGKRDPVNLEVEDGKIREGEYAGKALSDVVGKEMAEKILAVKESTKEFAGEGLNVGGEGMRGFYDQILPKALEKIGREHGVKVQKGELPDNRAKMFEGWRRSTDGVLTDNLGKKVENPELVKEYEKNTQPIFYIDIPQSLRDAAMRKGFPLFSGGKMFVPHQEEDK